jgi:thiol peroxidase
MADERMVTFAGTNMALSGTAVASGAPAPAFTAVNMDLKDVSSASFAGRAVVLTTVPSLDTPVCDLETRRFNEEAGRLGDRAIVLTVSMDLPFAQARWCGMQGADQVVTLSDYKYREVGHKYGVYIPDLGLLARAVFVIDPKGVIRYREIVPEVTHEPDYDAALSATRAVLQQ